MDEEECIAEYKLTLSELVSNAKVTINVLSMLADENKKCAPQIAGAIEDRIKTAVPSQKLPALYLVDSIIKNVKESDYLSLFTKNISSIFVCVFERGDEKVRAAMYKLRQTWLNLFPNEILLKLDLAVNSIDPAWPITAVRPAEGQRNVHVNPDFLNKAKVALKGLTSSNKTKITRPEVIGLAKKEDQPPEPALEGLKEVSVLASPNTLTSTETEKLLRKQVMAKQLLAKQQEMLQIEQRKIEIALAKTQMQIELQAKQLVLQQKQRQQLASQVTEDKSPKKNKVKKIRKPSKDDEERADDGDKKAEESSVVLPQPAAEKKLATPTAPGPSATQPGPGAQPLKIADAFAVNKKLPETLTVSTFVPTKVQTKKRKSGDIQKIDPRLRKKMMLNKDAPTNQTKVASETTPSNVDSTNKKSEVKGEGGIMKSTSSNEKPKKVENELSEDLKDLFGNEDKDFRMKPPPMPPVSLSDSNTQWKTLKCESNNGPSANNFTLSKPQGPERRFGAQNRFSPYVSNHMKHSGALHGNRKALLPTPSASRIGQGGLKSGAVASNSVENYEKLREMKQELDREAERLNSIKYDLSNNDDYEAFEADVKRGNSLLNKARWNSWRNSDRNKRMRQPVNAVDDFRERNTFGQRPQQRTLLPAPPRVTDFADRPSNRLSPPRFPHQPSPPQFYQQPRSPGQKNYNYNHDHYHEDDHEYQHYAGEKKNGRHDFGGGYEYDCYYYDENNHSPGENYGPSNYRGGYQHRSNHKAPTSAGPSNQMDNYGLDLPRSDSFQGPSFAQGPLSTTSNLSKTSLPQSLQSLFNDFVPPTNAHVTTTNTSNKTSAGQLNIHQLFSKLTEFGILKTNTGDENKEEIQKMNDFDVKRMKEKHKSLVGLLHVGVSCKTCGLRFPPTEGMERKKGEEQAKSRYLNHLDWHFQMNKKANSTPKAERGREFYPDLDTWFQIEVTNVIKAPMEEGNSSAPKGNDDGGFLANMISLIKQKPSDPVEEKLEEMRERYKVDLNTTPICKDMTNDNELCFMCHEGFDLYWDDEREEWCVKDAYKLEDKWFHLMCFTDFKGHEFYSEEHYPKTRPSTPTNTATSNDEDPREVTTDIKTEIGLENLPDVSDEKPLQSKVIEVKEEAESIKTEDQSDCRHSEICNTVEPIKTEPCE